jgi:periplasmic mercuric ion binding protein
MKTLSLFAIMLFSLCSVNAYAQEVKNETIKVWGNCGMCKTKIEKSALGAGATTADWNEESKMLQVSYAVNKSSATKIQKAVAKSGYDTEEFTADDKVYKKLHHCCQYERKAATAGNAKCCESESCAKDGHTCNTGGDHTCAKTSDKSAACCAKSAGN